MPAHRGSVIFTVLVALVVAVAAIPVLVVLAVSGAPQITLLAAVLAALPVPVVVGCYLWLDRYEPEPRSLLVLAMGWGAFVATAGAVVLGGVGGLLVGFTDQQSLAIVAPITEEVLKGAFLLLLFWWRRHEIDGVLDGIVYAGFVGIGFAFTENILYLAAAYNGTEGLDSGGITAVTTTFAMRCLASPFAHPLFTTFTGIGIGIAVGARSGGVRVLAPVAGLVLAMVAHGLWNGSTLAGFNGFLSMYLILMAPAFLLMISLALWLRGSEQTLLTRALDDAARRGMFPAEDVEYVVHLSARRASRRAARQQGPRAQRAVEDYLRAAVQLAYLHHRFLRGAAPEDVNARGEYLVTRLKAIRPNFRFPGQAVGVR